MGGDVIAASMARVFGVSALLEGRPISERRMASTFRASGACRFGTDVKVTGE
jgi:hypothetical protein